MAGLPFDLSQVFAAGCEEQESPELALFYARAYITRVNALLDLNDQIHRTTDWGEALELIGRSLKFVVENIGLTLLRAEPGLNPGPCQQRRLLGMIYRTDAGRQTHRHASLR